jgi:hypothetical protein
MKRVIFTLLLAATATARADDDYDYDVDNARRESLREFTSYVHSTKAIINNAEHQDLSTFSVKKCADTYAKAKAAGVKPDTEYAFIDLGKVRFSDTPRIVCAPYERAVHVAEAVQMLAKVKDGKQCASEMDRLLRFGIGDEEIEVRDVELKLADAKTKICEPLANGEPISKEEKEKARAAAAVPYEEAGITGAKLKICVANTTKIRLEGGATATPRDIRRASLLFVLSNPAKDKYELTRIEFKGDEIAKISEKTFAAPPVAADYR